jgi:hypothetical protein
MPGFRTTVKCGLCGTVLPATFDEITRTTQCPQCGGDLHTCKNCVNFNPASRFECEQPITQRISPKDRRADCDLFEVQTTVEKDVTSSKVSPSDAKAAFEDLFKF